MIKPPERRWRRRPGQIVLTCLMLTAVQPPAVSADPAAVPTDRLDLAGARLAWRLDLPLRSVASIKSCRLVDEYLVIISSDGHARAVRADTGDYVWSRQLAEEGDTLWPPVPCHSPGHEAIVFARLTDAVFLEPSSGRETHRIALPYPPSGPAAVSTEHLFTVGADARLRSYRIEGGIPDWQVQTPAPIWLAPLCGGDLVLVADAEGLLAAVLATDGTKLFARELGGSPRGWLAADHQAVYVATVNKFLHIVDPQTGQAVRGPYRLDARPTDGPVVTASSVYQATEGGVYRYGLKPGVQPWHDAAGRRFLAEWPNRTVVLRADGRVGLLRPDTGQLSAVLDAGDARFGVINTRNDAAIVVSARGEVRCLRPIGAGPLTPADFRPPPRPATQPSGPQTQPGAEVPPAATEPAE